MNDVENAIHRFRNGLNCSQSVLATYGPRLGLDETLSHKLASGLGGGLGRTGETCGAVTGAILVLGLRLDSGRAGDKESKDRMAAKAQEFLERFAEANGATRCRDLIRCDIRTPEKMAAAKADGVFDTICPTLIESAARILEELLADPPS